MKKCFYGVYRDADPSIGDCTLNGLSNRVVSGWMFFECTRKTAIKYCEENNINPNDCFFLCKRKLWGEDYSYAEPLIKLTGKNQMFGGNFLYSSNAIGYHFKDEKCVRPIPIHDRFEPCN